MQSEASTTSSHRRRLQCKHRHKALGGGASPPGQWMSPSNIFLLTGEDAVQTLSLPNHQKRKLRVRSEAFCEPSLHHVTPTHLIYSHMTLQLLSSLISAPKGEVRYAQILLEVSKRSVPLWKTVEREELQSGAKLSDIKQQRRAQAPPHRLQEPGRSSREEISLEEKNALSIF